MTASLIALLTALGPALLGVLGRVFFTDPRRLREIKRHAQLIKELPDSAKSAIEELVAAETRDYADRTLRRSQRKLNGGNLGALIVVGLFTAGIIYVGVLLALSVSPWWWIPTGLIGAFLLALTSAGFGKNFWTYPEPTDSDSVSG
jgi:hypothetical protein